MKMFDNKKQILLCSRCVTEQVPMLFTFKFDYHEYWCPRCGLLDEFLGCNSIIVPKTPELSTAYRRWLRHAEKFLSSRQTAEEFGYQYAQKY